VGLKALGVSGDHHDSWTPPGHKFEGGIFFSKKMSEELSSVRMGNPMGK
jgi:hypothetical protein